MKNRILKGALAITICMSFFTTTSYATNVLNTLKQGFENDTTEVTLDLVARYTSGDLSSDGGAMEIIAHNTMNGYSYGVNGEDGYIAIMNTNLVTDTTFSEINDASKISMESIIKANISDFEYGDMTSIAISEDGTLLAVALQASDFKDAGRVAIFKCNSDGTISFQTSYKTGVQPDMVLFVGNDVVLTADEGEPREGYIEGSDEYVDPKGSVTIIDLSAAASTIVTFDAFDSKRDDLVAAGIILQKDMNPSTDLEPEYISVSNGKAYVALQEANAIAVLDIASASFENIFSCGLVDYSKVLIDINKGDDDYNPQNYDGLYGIRMPDGIDTYEVNGTTYLLTANEGDGREYGDGDSEILTEIKIDHSKDSSLAGNIGEYDGEDNLIKKKITYFDPTTVDGLNTANDYLFGSRSFTLYKVTSTGLEVMFDSGEEFESLVWEYLPEYYNTSNDNVDLEDRSGKKGVEPESVIVGEVNNSFYAFVALERIGGIMVYDVTNPSNVSYVNYINTRDFNTVVYTDNDEVVISGGDVSPEGLAFIAAEDSPNNQAMLLVANEVSGTVSMIQVGTTVEEKVESQTELTEPQTESTDTEGLDTPQTGDRNAIVLWAGVLGLACMSLYMSKKEFH